MLLGLTDLSHQVNPLLLGSPLLDDKVLCLGFDFLDPVCHEGGLLVRFRHVSLSLDLSVEATFVLLGFSDLFIERFLCILLSQPLFLLKQCLIPLLAADGIKRYCLHIVDLFLQGLYLLHLLILFDVLLDLFLLLLLDEHFLMFDQSRVFPKLRDLHLSLAVLPKEVDIFDPGILCFLGCTSRIVEVGAERE